MKVILSMIGINGHGIFKWNNGEVYEGNWKNDKADGYGEYQSKDGVIYKGNWKDDQ